MKIKIISPALFIDRCSELLSSHRATDKFIGFIGSTGIIPTSGLSIYPCTTRRNCVWVDGRRTNILSTSKKVIKAHKVIDDLNMYDDVHDFNSFECFKGVCANNYIPNLKEVIELHRIITHFYLFNNYPGLLLHEIKNKLTS